MLDSDFIQAFVISLPFSRARRANIEACLNGNIDYHIVKATAGIELNGREREYCPDLYCPRFFRDLTQNEIACSISHRNALINFIESTARFGLILEDDAHIDLENFPRISNAARTLGDFDILKIGGSGKYVSEGIVAAKCDGVRILAALNFGVCAHAYIVSRAGAWKLIDTILPVREPYDAFLRNSYVHKCNIFETAPWLASLQPEAAHSTIGDVREARKYSWSIRKNFEAARFRLKHNVMTSVFNLRRFGLAYVTKSGFLRAVPSGN